MSRGGKVTTVVAVLVAIAGGGLIVGDRIAAGVAERRIGAQAQQELAARDITTAQAPKVTIGGFPFLTQVLAGRYDKITIVVDRPTSRGVTLDRLDVVALGVNAPAGSVLHGGGRITADQVTGTASLGWGSVLKLIDLSGYVAAGATASAQPDGLVRITAPVTALGRSITITATGNLSVSEGKVQLAIRQVSHDGTLPPIAEQLLTRFKRTFAVDIPPLPYHLVVRSAQAGPAGLLVTAAAQDVPIAGQAAG